MGVIPRGEERGEKGKGTGEKEEGQGIKEAQGPVTRILAKAVIYIGM